MEWLSTYNLTEVHDTRQENFAAPTPTASVRLKVKYSERYNAIRDLLSTPATYPFSNDICASGYVLYCTEARLAQNPSAYTSDDGQVIDYNDYSFIDATYTLQTGYYRAPGSTSNNEYVEETLEPRMETLPLNNNLYYWAGSDGSASVGENDPLATDESPVRSFTATIGFAALIGIEIKTSILLVDLTNQLRSKGLGLEEAIRRAGEVRFLPIVLTSLTAICGLLPLAVQGSAMYAPLAWVIIGGLVSSTLLARIVTLVMYKIVAPRMEIAH